MFQAVNCGIGQVYSVQSYALSIVKVVVRILGVVT